MERLPIYDCLIEDKDEVTGIYAISFVDFPANEVDFIAMNEQKPVYLNKDSQKQVLTGVVLKPEQLIYRISEELGAYYIKFSAEQIERIAQKMMKTGIALYNTTHQHQSQLSGNYLTELWTVENPEIDKSRALGFKDLPKGTLMCSYKIEDSNYWHNEVMTGNVKGFSLEGFFNQIPINNNLRMKKPKLKLNALQKRILSATLSKEQLSVIDEIENDDTTDSGETVRKFVLKEGGTVIVDEDGLATLDDEPLQPGEHALADGNILVIDESGKFVETKKASAENGDPQEATAPETLKKQTAAQKLEEITPNKGDALRAKIAEMQATIDALKSLIEETKETVEEQKSEIAELRKKTPSSPPKTPAKEIVNLSEMKATERMAYAIRSKVDRQKK